MRSPLFAALLLLSALPASADPPRRQKGVDETGKTRPIQIQAPEVGKASARTTDAPDVERGPLGEAPPPRLDAAPLSGALADVVERQMRRNQASIDTCLLEEVLRNPTASGQVTLNIEVVERKVKNAAVATDAIRSQPLNDCLVKAAGGWAFNLKAARFDWPVNVRPAQARR